MNQSFYRVYSVGFVAYCDALIARKQAGHMADGEYAAFMLSLVGTAANIQTIYARLYSGEYVRLTDLEPKYEHTGIPCSFYQGVAGPQMETVRNRKIGEIINKITVQRFVTGKGDDKAAVVFGPDMPTVQERAFRRLDAATSLPLKQSWTSWLWDEVMQPEELYSFGDRELTHAYLVSWPDEEELQAKVLEAVTDHYLH